MGLLKIVDDVFSLVSLVSSEKHGNLEKWEIHDMHPSGGTHCTSTLLGSKHLVL